MSRCRISALPGAGPASTCFRLVVSAAVTTGTPTVGANRKIGTRRRRQTSAKGVHQKDSQASPAFFNGELCAGHEDRLHSGRKKNGTSSIPTTPAAPGDVIVPWEPASAPVPTPHRVKILLDCQPGYCHTIAKLTSKEDNKGNRETCGDHLTSLGRWESIHKGLLYVFFPD